MQVDEQLALIELVEAAKEFDVLLVLDDVSLRVPRQTMASLKTACNGFAVRNPVLCASAAVGSRARDAAQLRRSRRDALGGGGDDEAPVAVGQRQGSAM